MVSDIGRELAINLFEQHLDTSDELLRDLRSFSWKGLLCHCSRSQSCHADALIRKFSSTFRGAYDRGNSQRPPTSAELNLLAMHREEPQCEKGSSEDEGAPPRVQVGAGWVIRCLWESDIFAETTAMAEASPLPTRWPLARRRYPDSDRWQSVVSSYVTTRHNEVIDEFGPVGPGVRIPRLPALYKRHPKQTPRTILKKKRQGGTHLEEELRAMSSWFSPEILQEEWPWVFAKGQNLALITATLGCSSPRRIEVMVRGSAQAATNQNGALLNKLNDNNLPGTATVDGVSTYMKKDEYADVRGMVTLRVQPGGRSPGER